MADRIARTVLGGGKWVWEIKKVSSGGAWLRVSYDSGAKYLKFVEIAKEVGEMAEWIRMDLAKAEREGLRLNISATVIGEAVVVVGEGKIGFFADVMVNWMPGVTGMTRDDVEELMTEAGLL